MDKSSDKYLDVNLPREERAAASLLVQLMQIQTGPECWQWAGRLGKGRAQFTSREGTYTTARFIYKCLHPDVNMRSRLVHHTCCNPACVNPRHLVLLTNSEHQKIHSRLRRSVVETREPGRESVPRPSAQRQPWWTGHGGRAWGAALQSERRDA